MRMPVFVLFLACAALNAQDQPAGRGVNFYSQEKEAAMGAQMADQARQSMKMVESPTVREYLTRAGARLLAQIPDTGFALHIEIFADQAPGLHEARVYPGGYIFTPSSLFLAARDEAEFAGMLEHSIAHVAARDATRQASRGTMANLATIPLIFVGGWSGYIAKQAQGTTLPMSFLTFQKAAELAADQSAVRMMAGAGWDPGALARYLEREQPSEDGAARNTLSPLPERSARVAALRQTIQELPPRQYSTAGEFTTIQAEVRRLAP